MTKPEMIIFDYGHTLLYEPDWNSDRGNAELLKYATKNSHNCTVEDIRKAAELIYGKHVAKVREYGYEISGQAANKTLYDYLGIEFSLSPSEMETVFWDSASVGAIMPDADRMIDYLNEKDIKTAVISNLSWSGEALTKRLNRLLPNNKFEFVMTSSDYFIRKPNSILFEIALKKAGLSANKVWFCGDSVYADVDGAYSVGMFPVLYEGSTAEENPSVRDNAEMNIDFEYLHIHDWREMIEVLEKL
ncbi:HAD family hydrolase [Ruminococcus sp. Marseille-P6503]|uniref:HAD family hydrolase n=1 Tax=Ruminococcus sp. Marseille-P6503 TaxID=2364796 RepID=UPI000F53B62F|nr:HAD family hydrolase [Ruminococcus sp. Marseille-P6503]